MTRAFLPLAVLAVTVTGCHQAPKPSGANQVYDPNVEATAQKDNRFESMSWQDVDEVMEGLVPDPSSEPGCAVGIVRDDTILYLQGYGYARLPQGGDPGEKWGVATMGAVGSVSKSFTATAALRMHDQGLLNVNHDVGSYLATGNAALGGVPIYELLAHSSGVGGASQDEAFQPDWEPASPAQGCIDEDPDLEPLECQAVAQTMARPAAAFGWYEGQETVAALGSSGSLDEGVYSNVGYSVLGAVIDAVAQDETTSDGYEAYVWNNVGRWSSNVLEGGHLLSLALTHSWRDGDIPHRAKGYLGNGPSVSEAWEETGSIEGWEGPSGGWALTIGDLARFMVALDEGKFFADDNLLTAMRMAWSDLDGFGDDYGFGMFIGDGDVDSPDSWHGGVIGPHNAVWTWWENYDGHEIGVAMMCNRGDAGVWTQKGLAADIAAIAAVQNPDPPSQIVLPPVQPSAVNGQTYVLDSRGAWQAAPSGAFVPLTTLKNTLLLRPSTTGALVAFTLTEGRATSSGVSPAKAPVPLGTASFSSPRFTTPPRNVALATPLGDVTISQLSIRGAFADEGRSMSDVSLSGVIDTRQFVALGGPPWTSICGDVRSAGAACRPCADQIAACVPVRYEGLRGATGGGR